MSTEGRLTNRYFLVVDDEEFVRKLIVRFLRAAGAADVIEAANGREAIAVVDSYDMAFDAVISDIEMTPVDGIELLRAIRTGMHGLKRNLPVLMLTAHADSELVAEALRLDADAFVLKPVGNDALIDRVCRILAHGVPIQSASSYGAPGGAPAAHGAAPPSKDLAAAANPTSEPKLSALHAQGDSRYAAALSDEVAVSARKVPLGMVRPNSILAQDLRFGAPPKLLLAAPMILTACVIDRLKDLATIHQTFDNVYVVEPVS